MGFIQTKKNQKIKKSKKFKQNQKNYNKITIKNFKREEIEKLFNQTGNKQLLKRLFLIIMENKRFKQIFNQNGGSGSGNEKAPKKKKVFHQSQINTITYNPEDYQGNQVAYEALSAALENEQRQLYPEQAQFDQLVLRNTDHEAIHAARVVEQFPIQLDHLDLQITFVPNGNDRRGSVKTASRASASVSQDQSHIKLTSGNLVKFAGMTTMDIIILRSKLSKGPNLVLESRVFQTVKNLGRKHDPPEELVPSCSEVYTDEGYSCIIMTLCTPLSNMDLLPLRDAIDHKLLVFTQCGLCDVDIKPDNMCLNKRPTDVLQPDHDVLFLDMDPKCVYIYPIGYEETVLKYMKLQFWWYYNRHKLRQYPRVDIVIFITQDEHDTFCRQLFELSNDSLTEHLKVPNIDQNKEAIKVAGRERVSLMTPLYMLSYYCGRDVPKTLTKVHELVEYAVNYGR
jgi:hypothetical protein